jgi:putative ABC transport system substrate-binding protein
MKRREFIGHVGGGTAAFWPLAAHAQWSQGMRKPGVLMIVAENDPESRRRIAALQQGLRDHGWQDGQNIHIEYRWAAGRPDLISPIR